MSSFEKSAALRHLPGTVLRILNALFPILKEILRHLLRRPVVGVSVVARTGDGRILLIRRGDTAEWALPGGTVEWGETLRSTAVRELLEEGGVTEVELGPLLATYSAPARDPRFHAVSVVVAAAIGEPTKRPMSSAEIRDVHLFPPGEVPLILSHGNQDMLSRALEALDSPSGPTAYWE